MRIADREPTRLEQAELLVDGIRASGLDVDEALSQLDALPSVERAFAVQEYQLIGLADRMAGLPDGLLPGGGQAAWGDHDHE